jgi:hypothetical protein
MKPTSLLFLAAAGAASLLPASSSGETTVSLPPAGMMIADLTPGARPLSFPLLTSQVFVGTLANGSGDTLTFSQGLVGPALIAGEKYYAEITGGPLEGERFDVQTAPTIAAANTTVVLDLTPASFSTMNVLPADGLVGARCVLREHLTLKKLPALFSPSLVGHNSAALADGVQLHIDGMLRLFFLRSDGQTWREPGKVVDERNRVIPRDAGLLLQLKSGAKQLVLSGDVRTHAFRINLKSSEQPFATGFPLDMSPLQLGAFVDPALPANIRWTGSDQPAQADTLKIFNPSAGVFENYYLRADGVTWAKKNAPGNFTSAPIVPAIGITLLKRNNADSGYLILPFTL